MFPIVKRYKFSSQTYIDVEFISKNEGTVIHTTSNLYKIGWHSVIWNNCYDKIWEDVPRPKYELPDELFIIDQSC